MRLFYLNRLEDPSGVSGVGQVAEGVVFNDGQVVLSWIGRHHAISIWPSIEHMLAIHGHEGKTFVDWCHDVNANLT